MTGQDFALDHASTPRRLLAGAVDPPADIDTAVRRALKQTERPFQAGSNRLSIVCILLLLVLLHSSPAAAASIRPPRQPVTGPGGSSLAHAHVQQRRYGEGAGEFWILEPSSPVPATAPVVIFLHGFGADDPAPYAAWLDHLVRRGNIVIYPRYQDRMMTSLSAYWPNTLKAVHAALAELEKPGHVHPDLDHVASVGHAMGGVLAVTLAIAATDPANHLPPIAAVMSVAPCNFIIYAPSLTIPLPDLSRLPASTLLLTVVGDRDRKAKTDTARRIFLGASQVPITNKNFVTVHSDEHGSPDLIAGHFAPLASEQQSGGLTVQTRSHPPNAIDFYGYWKLLDALTDAAFSGKNREIALGGGGEQVYMGRWSDGTAVSPLSVTTAP